MANRTWTSRPLFSAALLLAGTIFAHPQAIEWVARYHGGGPSTDSPNKVVVDLLGNCYVAGSSGGAFETVKYGPDGTKLWAARYVGTGKDSAAVGAVVDATGNVYVAGSSSELGSGQDIVTIKYDSLGNRVWVAKYDGPNPSDSAVGLGLDADGNVIVGGYSVGSNSHDYTGVVVKYTSAGSELWESSIPGMRARAICVDPLGRAIITGAIIGTSNLSTDATAGVGADGTVQWITSFDGASYGNTGLSVAAAPSGGAYAFIYLGTQFSIVALNASGAVVWSGTDSYSGTSVWSGTVTVDTSGCVYVAAPGSATAGAFKVYKFDGAGNRLWGATYDSSHEDTPLDLAVDSASGDVYVTGRSGTSSSDFDFATVAFDSTGHQKWVKTFNGTGNGKDEAHSLAVGPLGGVVVTGASLAGPNNTDFVTIRYDQAGNQQWLAQFDGPANGPDWPKSFALDGAGGAYVFGQSLSSESTNNAITIHYDAAGNELWTRRPSPASFTGYNPGAMTGVANDGICTVATANNGNTILIRYAPNGDTRWTTEIAPPLQATVLPEAISADVSGGIYTAGWLSDHSSSNSVSKFATTRFDSNGNAVWSRSAQLTSLMAIPAAITVSTTGNVAVAGQWFEPSMYSDAATYSYDASGNPLWERYFSYGPSLPATAHAVAIDAAGNVYMGGDSNSNGFLVIKYDAGGNQLWKADYKAGSGTNSLSDLALGSSGAIFVTGISSSEWATLAYSPNGNMLWERRYSPPAGGEAAPLALAADANGNVYVTGYVTGPNGDHDLLTVEYDSVGSVVWSSRYDGPGGGSDSGLKIAVDPSGCAYATGASYGGDDTGQDIVTIKYGAATGWLGGTVSLENYVGGAGIAGTAQFRFPGTLAPLFERQVTLDDSGGYSIGDVPSGTYDIAMKFRNWLRRVAHSVQIGMGLAADFALENGDATGDNRVTIPDLSTVLAEFGSTGQPGIPGDLQWDGRVGISDLSIVLMNFNLLGDP